MAKTYHRVIPRDLFNEAKLLKCIGRLCLKIEDKMTPIPMIYEHDGKPFEIKLSDEGILRVTNIYFYMGKNKVAQAVWFVTTYNSKSVYPLFAEHKNTQYKVFDDNGEWDEEFLEFCKTL